MILLSARQVQRDRYMKFPDMDQKSFIASPAGDESWGGGRDPSFSKKVMVTFSLNWVLMDMMSSFENAEVEAKHQKYKSRVVLRGENYCKRRFKDGVKSSLCHLKNIHKGRVVLQFGVLCSIHWTSHQHQMTAARIMDIISRLLGCAGQAADAVSAYTQIKMEDAPKLLKIPKSECPDIWIRLPRQMA